MAHRSENVSSFQGGGDLVHRIEAYADGEECTLFPECVPEEDLVTRWITAEDGAFVDLAEMR